MVLKIIRMVLGNLIVFLNNIFPPRKLKRSKSEQIRLDQESKSLLLYQFPLCPFCIRVRRHITRLNITIELRDAKKNTAYEDELIQGGGKRKVPCLRIEKNGTTWLYESREIIAYLDKKFGTIK